METLFKLFVIIRCKVRKNNNSIEIRYFFFKSLKLEYVLNNIGINVSNNMYFILSP